MVFIAAPVGVGLREKDGICLILFEGLYGGYLVLIHCSFCARDASAILRYYTEVLVCFWF